LPSCSRSSEEHLGVHVGPESDKCAPIYPQEGTVKIWIEGRDTSRLGSIISLSNEARTSRVAPCS
jgi:hypothetical protein